ncbi:MAG: hypothetical protein ACRED0_04355, partial [Gammaproteobacteria bacterium]
PSLYQALFAYDVALHFSRRAKPYLDFIEVFPTTPAPTVEDELEIYFFHLVALKLYYIHSVVA